MACMACIANKRAFVCHLSLVLSEICWSSVMRCTYVMPIKNSRGAFFIHIRLFHLRIVGMLYCAAFWQLPELYVDLLHCLSLSLMIINQLRACENKVKIFWEGRKKLKKCPSFIWRYLLSSKKVGFFFQIFVAFSEYLNFKGLVVEKFLAIHNEIFPKFDILMCNVPKYTYIRPFRNFCNRRKP